MAKRPVARSKKGRGRPLRRPIESRRARFVGRDPSPVLDRYPPKAEGSAPRGPPPIPPSSAPASPTPPASTASIRSTPPSVPPPSVTSQPLITLERPFDIDEFSSLLGETSIRMTVPRDALPEVLRRVTEFMGFGIYVYTVSVRPASSELLKGFVVELQRVDYSAEKGAWVAFVEKGTTDSPFGPSGDRS